MPRSSRLLAVAVSSLLVSSAFAGVIYPRDTQVAEQGVIGSQYQYTPSRTSDVVLEGPRFRRHKRQEIPLDEGTVVASDGPMLTEAPLGENASDAEIPNPENEPPTGESPTSEPPTGEPPIEQPPIDDSGTNGDAGSSGVEAPPPGPEDDISNAPPIGDPSEPPGQPPPGEDSGTPPLMSDGTGDPEVEASIAQDLIARSQEELQGDQQMTQQDLGDLATAVEYISADFANRPDPGKFDVQEKVKDEMKDWDSRTDEEKKQLYEKSLYKGVTGELEMSAVVINLLGVAEKIVNGDVKSGATEGLEGIPSEDVPSNSTVVAALIEGGSSGEPSAALRKRALEKRFIGTLASWLGFSAKASAGLEIKTPVGGFGVGISAAIGKATNADPPKPKEVIIFDNPRSEERPQQPQQAFPQPQQPQQPYNYPQQTSSQQSFRQLQDQPLDTERSAQQPKPTVPGWDNTYQKNQGFQQANAGWDSTYSQNQNQGSQGRGAPGWDNTYAQNQGRGTGWKKVRRSLKGGDI
ncbi:hypothetical protein TWF281_010225 [Arthrobotrys megalospora]